MFPIKIDKTEFITYYNLFMIRSSEKTLIIKIDSLTNIYLVGVLEGISEMNSWISPLKVATLIENRNKEMEPMKIRLYCLKNSNISGKITMMEAKNLEYMVKEDRKGYPERVYKK